MDEDRVLAAIAEGRRESRLAFEKLDHEMHGEMGSIREEITSLRTVLLERFERVEDRLTSMADDITVNMMAVTVENSKRTADRIEMSQLVGVVYVMERQLRRMRTELDELKKAS